MTGKHLKIEGRGAPGLLGNTVVIEAFLRDLVERIQMRPLGEPHIYDVPQEISKIGSVPFEDEGGVTGFCVLSTSHIAIHTWPLRSSFVLDVYSCRDFEQRIVFTHLLQRLDASELLCDELVPHMNVLHDKQVHVCSA